MHTLFVLLASLSTNALAAPDDAGLRLGLGAGWFQPDGRETVIDGSWVIVPRVGYSFNHTIAMELESGWSQGTTRTVDRSYNVFTPRLNVLFHAPDTGPVTFFAAVGPGLYYKNVNKDDVHDTTNENLNYGQFQNPDTDMLLNAGPGALVRFGESPFGLRTDFRYALSAGGTKLDLDADGDEESDLYHNWEWTFALNLWFRGGDDDADKDGILDDADQCVNDPEDKDDWQDEDGCPDKDNDKDGILDSDEDCDNEPEDIDEFEDQDGCPDPDNDDDGVVDTRDECPLVAGTPATNGCPDRDGDTVLDSVDVCPDVKGSPRAEGCPDRDDDQVPDSRDKCPDEPADPRIDPKRSDGCPSRVVVTKEEVVILDKVFFDTNKATIKKESYAILDEVARVLSAYADIKKVEIQGHTDGDGTDAANLDLSQRRANAVAQYLVKKGISADRLVAKGFGEGVPLASNETAEGKATNRRVEFKILEQ